MYRMLSLDPGAEFGSEVAADPTGTSVEQASDLLTMLVDMSMVSDVGDDSFRLHDLLRVYARHRAEQDEPEEARRSALRAMG